MQRQESGRWVVDRLQKEHNHDLDSPMDASSRLITAASKAFREEVGDGLENLDLGETTSGCFNLVKRGRERNVGSDWHPVLLEYFHSRQAEDTGFFYAVEVDDGKCTSIFWADGRARFSCGQFGDAIISNTAYRMSTSSYFVPFASFVGINHHRQPVLLGCALIADESEESFTWVFQTWLRVMLGRHPLSIIADQDEAIQHSIAQVFPGTHHRFSSTCQIIKAKEEQQQYLGTFFAGIIPMPTDGSCMISFFGTFLNAQTPLNKFVARYEKALEQRREEEEGRISTHLTCKRFCKHKTP